MNYQEIINSAITKFGQEKQSDMVIEEMSELTKAILKYRRNTTEMNRLSIVEEIADVEIMIEQAKIMFDWSGGEHVEKIKQQKLLRLKEQL